MSRAEPRTRAPGRGRVPGAGARPASLGHARSLLAGALALLVAASRSRADGVNLAWDGCGAAGAAVRQFACDTNAGSAGTLYATFVPPPGVSQFLGIQSQIDLTADALLPDWWRFGVSLCRGGDALQVDFQAPSGSACRDLYGGLAVGGIAYDVEFNGQSNRARLRASGAIPESDRVGLSPDSEYFAFRIEIAASGSRMPGGCAGCLEEACIVLNEIDLVQPQDLFDDRRIVVAETRNWVTWQAPSIANCPEGTPVRRATWGRLRSLYR